MHPSHDTRFSDASSFDEICKACGVTDAPQWAERAREPCPKAKGTWKCQTCGAILKAPITDDTTCKCDFYTADWVRVKEEE